MYFWRIHRLKSELATRDVPPRDVLGYVIVYLLLMSLGNLAAFFPAEEPVAMAFTWREALFTLASIIILVLGMLAAYRANGGDHGRDLAARLLALGWVLGVRFGAFLLPVLIVLAVALVALGLIPSADQDEVPGSVMSVLFGFFLLISGFYYWRLAHHLRDVNRTATEPPTVSL